MKVFECSKCKTMVSDICLLIVCDKNIDPIVCPYSKGFSPEWRRTKQRLMSMNRCIWGEVDREGWTVCKARCREGDPLPYCNRDPDDPTNDPQEYCSAFVARGERRG